MNFRHVWQHPGRWMAVVLGLLIGAEGQAQAPDSAMVEEYAARRRAFAGKMAPNTVALFRAAPTYLKNGDQEHAFRQANNLYYLTGYPEREAVLLLASQPIIAPRIGQDPVREVLFVMDRNPARETWDGIRFGPARAGTVFGFKTALSIAVLEGVAMRLFATVDTVLFDYGMRTGRRPLPADQALVEATRSRLFDITVRDAELRLAAARQVKSPSEIRLLREAILITCDAQKAAMRKMRPGMFEYEIQAEIEYVFTKRGAVRRGFSSIVGSGPMTCILHYDKHTRQTQDGELVLMDLGAEYGMYSADVTRTVPVSGTFTDRQRAVYEIVLDAQQQSMEMIRPGVSRMKVQRKATEVIQAGLIELGLIEKASEYRKYYMHGSSHWLGLDVHDIGATDILAPGMVLTVEPGIYIPEESLGVRIEDDVLVTEDGYELLSGSAPRTVAAIERLMKR